MSCYLITGIAGFVGSSIAEALVKCGHEVRGIDDFSMGSRENLTTIEEKVHFHYMNLNSVSDLRAVCEGVDYILHQAAIASVPRSIENPEASHQANINGTFHLLQAARSAGVKRIVYAASSSAYGNQQVQPKHESMLPSPLSPYAVQKLACEYYMQSYFHVYGLETVSLRYFNVFGPKQAADSPYSGVIAKFIQMMLSGETPIIFGSGSQSRDFTYIENVVSANLLACTAERSQVTGKVFNIGTGKSYTLLQTYRLIASLLGFSKDPKYGAERRGDIEHSLADIASASNAFGYLPSIGFEEGMNRTVAWYKEQAEQKSTVRK